LASDWLKVGPIGDTSVIVALAAEAEA
jgi:hypothetical protein